MIFFDILFGAVVGGVAFRVRGDRWPNDRFGIGTTGARAIWAAAVGILTLPWIGWWALLALVGAFLGSIPGWNGAIDMGRDGGTATSDALRGALRGLVWTVPIGLALALAGKIEAGAIVSAAGLLMPLCYELGWRLPTFGRRWLADFAWGEVIFGAVIGASLAGALAST